MEETIVQYIKTLPKKKRQQMLLLLGALADSKDEQKCINLESSGFDFDDWRIIQSNIFQIVFTESLIKKVLLSV